MLETKSITISPSTEQHTIDLWQNFGWSVKSSQTVDNTDSHLENRGGTVYNVTERTNYVKLVFERDTKMDNYSTIVANENEFYSIMNSEPDAPQVGFSFIIAIILLCLWIIPGIAYIAYKIFKKKQANEQYTAAMAEWEPRRQKALNLLKETRALL